MLTGRHLDHVIICTIYGMCRVHSPSCFQGDAPKPNINNLFSHITDAYMSTSRHRTVGRTRLSQIQTNMSWILTEIQLPNQQKGDIIRFYNELYLPRMKEYIVTTKNMELQQGARTPVLSQSNFDALLTPGGSIVKHRHVKQLCPMTPLID